MPTWGEFLDINMRWKDVKYLKDSFTIGLPPEANASHYGKGDVPIDYVRTDPGIFQSEIATIVPADGKPVYEQYCETCHGANGKGNGPGDKNACRRRSRAVPQGHEPAVHLLGDAGRDPAHA